MVKNIINIQPLMAKDLHLPEIVGRPLQKGPFFAGYDKGILHLKAFQYFEDRSSLESLQRKIESHLK